MTVSTSDITSGPYTGNGALDEYSYDFTVQNKAHLEVFETTDAGVRTTLTVDVDYTVNDVGVDGGGTITRLAGNLPTDYIWYVRAAYPEDQETDFTALGAFSPSIHELQFDHLTYLVKQLSDKLGRALTFTKELVAPAGVDVTLPAPEASKIAAVWNSAGTALEIGPDADEISSAQGYAVAAAASAASAADTYDTFDDRYLGDHASDPTTLNDGVTALDASHDGIEYWDSTLKVRKTFNGSTLLWGLTSASAATNGVDVNLADAGGYYPTDNVEAALQELGTFTNTHVYAYLTGADQSLTSGNVIQFNAEVTDPLSNFDSTTNHRYTPSIPGKYEVIIQVGIDTSASTQINIILRKNGIAYAEEENQVANAIIDITAHIHAVVDMNGTTDYLDVIGTPNMTVRGDVVGTGPIKTSFYAKRIGA